MKAITMIKKYVLVLLLLSYNAHAAVVIDQSNTIKPTPSIKPNFELKNKLQQDLHLWIQNGSNLVLSNYVLKAATGTSDADYSYLRLSDLNLKLPSIVTIVNAYGDVQAFVITPDNKTIYLSYDENVIKPQKGGGVFNKALSKTASGLDLKNNITDKNIAPLSKTKREKNLEEMMAAPYLTDLQKKWNEMSLSELEREELALPKRLTANEKQLKDVLLEKLHLYETKLRKRLVESWQDMTPSELEKEAQAIAKKQYSNNPLMNKEYIQTIQKLIKKNANIDPFSRKREKSTEINVR